MPTGLHLGLGVRTVATSRNFMQGGLQQSNSNLDVAIKGNGFFQVTLPDGTAVVIKVQRPGVGQTIQTDLNILLAQARFLEARSEALRHYHLVAVVEELASPAGGGIL